MSIDWRALCAELLAALDRQAAIDPEADSGLLRRRARAALAQPEPVRLTDFELVRAIPNRWPSAGDCDGEGRCWFWGEQLSDSDDDWGWKLLDRTYGINWSGGPWLPAHALPLPATDG